MDCVSVGGQGRVGVLSGSSGMKAGARAGQLRRGNSGPQDVFLYGVGHLNDVSNGKRSKQTRWGGKKKKMPMQAGASPRTTDIIAGGRRGGRSYLCY